MFCYKSQAHCHMDQSLPTTDVMLNAVLPFLHRKWRRGGEEKVREGGEVRRERREWNDVELILIYLNRNQVKITGQVDDAGRSATRSVILSKGTPLPSPFPLSRSLSPSPPTPFY